MKSSPTFATGAVIFAVAPEGLGRALAAAGSLSVFAGDRLRCRSPVAAFGRLVGPVETVARPVTEEPRGDAGFVTLATELVLRAGGPLGEGMLMIRGLRGDSIGKVLD